MKHTILLIITFFSAILLPAQKAVIHEFASIDKKALQLPDSLTKTTDDIAKFINANFTNDNDKARAIFIWVATNIQYDIENMFAINFYEKREDKISKPLRTRKGICENYATLFNDICGKTGIESYLVEGFTKQNGFTDYIPHAWCAAKIDTLWYIYDPTWGSGYVNNGKFIKKISNDYYKVNPATIIKSHMPFDYMWQFLNYPVTNQEFYEGKTQINKSKPYFNFTDTIHIYEKQDRIEQLVSTEIRIEKNGIKNSMIFDRLQHIKIEIENDRQNKTVNLYNSAVADYNDGTHKFNEFIYFRNKQFKPEKPDEEIKRMLDSTSIAFKEAGKKLAEIISPEPNLLTMIKQLTKSINDASIPLKEQQDWLNLYFSKGKLARKSMFYKVTLYGIPVN
ncbi:MAG: transglutaminase domain-containing protein [Ginsengibacter sp.]